MAKLTRTTLRLDEDLHRRLKTMAAENDMLLQDLVDIGLKAVAERGPDLSAGTARRKKGRPVPAELESLVEAFVEFWQREKTPFEMEVQRMIDRVLKLPPSKSV